ncbi:MAG TPA: NAD-dependent epimerase/dehydratase family protein [Steroidobacteraceae bacterium]|nr:NAD-dependent epimerase/dehydratase family protein [Steroidobacteraceae bacterium]
MNLRPRVLIVGCGYVGQHLALALRATDDVLAIVRSEVSRVQQQSQGIDVLAMDLDTIGADAWPLSAAQVDRAKLFYLAPPPNNGVSDSRLDRFLRRLKGRPDVFIYMSTTGVYGDQRGDEVDESTPVNPQTDRAQRRMSAEHMTRVWCNEQQVRRVVLRVPGIYGPGRIALARLQRREPFVRADEAGITNRIHVDDLVAACIAVAQREDARGVYNVTDGNAMSSTEFMRRVAKIANVAAPVEISREEASVMMSEERLSFLDESRRVSNRRLLKELGLQLKYADVDAGIRASI